MELLPTRATFAPGEPVVVEIRAGGSNAELPHEVSLWHLDRCVATVSLASGETHARFDAQPEGGYGVEAAGARTAVDVLADPLSRARYGFISDFSAGRETSGVGDNVRRLHLNAIQFYDWMYRHAALLPPQDDFQDALGRPLSLASVRRLVETVRAAGSLPLGYAAVYAAGSDDWPRWRDAGLYRPDGTPWMLGDFLWNVDPTDERWVVHFSGELRAALEQVGFAGFHLDQYGAPKYALRADGSEVDLADAFPALIDRLAGELPEARLIFNNVNDFPTWSTARTNQAAVYIEVWPPHTTLADLGHLIGKARAIAPDKSVVLAAYLSPYAHDDEIGALAGARLQLATVFSHGATSLLHGEEDAVLTEAYYVRHARLGSESQAAMRCYYDFAVRYGDLLFDREAVDVTKTHLGGVNEEIKVDALVPVEVTPTPGALWVRAIRTRRGLLLSFIDLSAERDTLWDSPKLGGSLLTGVRLHLERRRSQAPRFLFADPELSPRLEPLEPESRGRDDVVALPAFRTWALVWVPGDDR